MPSVSDRSFDVLIVGGGPAGLSAALILGRACRRVAVIDAGEPRNAAADTLHGYLGRDGTEPKALLSEGRTELGKYDVQVFADRAMRVAAIDRIGGKVFPTAFRVRTRDGRTFLGRKLLFATGVRDDLPDIPGLRERYGSTIHHCPYCDGWEHRGKRLIAYGSEPSKAVGLALALRTWSARITALTDGRFAAEEERRELAAADIGLSELPVRRIVSVDDDPCVVEFQDGSALGADAMFFNAPQRSACDLPRSIGCEMEDEREVRTHGKQKTNVPGVYLAGDAAGDVQFVIVSAGEGARAAVAINRELQDERQEADRVAGGTVDDPTHAVSVEQR